MWSGGDGGVVQKYRHSAYEKVYVFFEQALLGLFSVAFSDWGLRRRGVLYVFFSNNAEPRVLRSRSRATRALKIT